MGRNQSNQGQGLNNKTSNGSIQNKRNYEKNANIDNTIVEEKANEFSKSENKENRNEKQNTWKAKGAWSKGAPGSHHDNKNNNNNQAATAATNIPASESTNKQSKPNTASETEVKKTLPPKPKITYAQILKPTPKPTSPKKAHPKQKQEPKKEVEKKETTEAKPIDEKKETEKTEETKTEVHNEVPKSPKKEASKSPIKETPKSPDKAEAKKQAKTPATIQKTESTTNASATPKGKQANNQNSIPPGFKQSRPIISRKLKQEVAVVMPMNNNRPSHGVQFGSLKSNSVDIEEDKQEQTKKENAPEAVAPANNNAAPAAEVKAEQEPAQEQPAKANKNAHANHQQNANARHNNKNANNAVSAVNTTATNAAVNNNMNINANITSTTTTAATAATTTTASIQSNIMASTTTPTHNIQKTDQPQTQQQQAYYNNAINNGVHNTNNILNRYGYSQNQQIPGIQFNATHLSGVPDYSNIYNDPQLRGYVVSYFFFV